MCTAVTRRGGLAHLVSGSSRPVAGRLGYPAQLGEQLDKVEPVADDAEAEVAQVFLGQQEDGAAVDVVVEEGGGEVPQPERL